MNQEYQIPTNPNNPAIQTTPGSVVSFANNYVETRSAQPERIDQVARKMFEIGQNITNARSRYIDQNFPLNNASERSIVKSAFKKIFNKTDRTVFRNETELKQAESQIGASLFAASIATGEVIHFFNDNPKSWFFHKETGLGTKDIKSFTIHYEINEGGILRVSDLTGAKGEYISGQELSNFTRAVELYEQQIFTRIYGCDTLGNSIQ